MNHDGCTATDHSLCHLSERARARYLELMRGGCPEQAGDLKVRGIWS